MLLTKFCENLLPSSGEEDFEWFLPYMYGSLSKNGAILVLDGFLASAMSEVCFFHV